VRVQIVEHGSGKPLVLVPGVQGRWEYLQPAIEALAREFRVLTFALAGERGAGVPFDPARGFDNYADQIEAVLGDGGIGRAVVCGISFGGLGALRFAATRPRQTSALVLVSTPGPRWGLRKRHEFYLRHPYVFGPFFLAETPFRLRSELVSAFPRRSERAAFARRQLAALVGAPLSPGRMAERGRLLLRLDMTDDCRRVTAPTLVVTGERALDYVVPAEGTLEYARLIARASAIVLDGTGHLGCNTRPGEFARAVREFVANAEREHAA
jgi:pimeloyl-ACP methyl ester carboxylesterase